MKPYRHETIPLLSAFAKRPYFGNGLDRYRVNGKAQPHRKRCNAVTNETV